MEKTCPKCKRPLPLSLLECPHCGLVLSKWKPKDPSPESRPDPKLPPKDIQNRRRVSAVPILIAGAVIAALSISAFFFSRSGGMRSVQIAVQKIQGREWKYPPGDAAETARVMSVQQLIEAWETVPGSSQTAIHATYAQALGLKGKEAAGAIEVLARHVTDKDLYIRQGAMEGLAGIGEEGLSHILKALNYWNKADANAVTIRWDAAIAIARMGPRARNAEKDLLAAIINPEENPNVKGDAAVALAGIGNDAVPSLNKARCYFYDQNGTSIAETGVLRTINIALQNMNAATEPCKGLEGQQGTVQGTTSSSDSTFLRASDLSRMQVPQLLESLRSHPYNTQMIADELVKKGARAQAVDTLHAMLRDRSLKGSLGIRMALGKLNAPVVADSSRNSFLPVAEDNIGYIELSAETKGDAIYSSGKIYVGRDVIAGLSRPQKGMVTLPTFVKYTLTTKGGSLGQPVEKTFDVNTAGEHSWDNVLLASGIGTGKYTVSLFLHAQFVKEDGTGQILNNNAGFLGVER